MVDLQPVNVVINSLNQLVVRLVDLLPKLIVALLIWYIGKYLLGLAVRLLAKVDIKQTRLDDKAVDVFSRLILVVGQAVLFLVILDYLGIGRTIVGALANGFTFAIAIALGLAFGKALEQDAKNAVALIKKFFQK